MNAFAKACRSGVTLGFILAIAIPVAASAVTFAGTWSVSGTIGNPVVARVSPVCKFSVVGNKLAGTCRGPNGVGGATGVFAGRKVTFSWHHVATNAIGATGVSTFKGTLGGDGVIRGTWTSSMAPALWGTFTAIRP